MPKSTCGKMLSGCRKSGNGFHKCKQKITLTKTEEKKVNQGGRIDGPLRTDYCKGHACEFCDKKY